MRFMAWASVTAPRHIWLRYSAFRRMEYYTVITRKTSLTTTIESPATQLVLPLRVGLAANFDTSSDYHFAQKKP